MPTNPGYSPNAQVFDIHNADDLRLKIDKEIQDLEESVRRLKTRRNMLASISRLPTELLYKIFSTLACLDYSNPTDVSWIRPITAVCSHWRAVALECPRLWSSIIFSRPSWAAEMLKRSKMAPLAIRADLTYLTPKMVDAVQMALQHVSRIRELHLTASKATMEKLIDNLNQRAPLLQSLCLSNPRYSHFLMDDGYTLPTSLFDGDGHRLQRLELVKCNIRWDSPLLCGLTQIKIHKMSNMCRPTMPQLLDALEKMPLLESLDMEDSLPVLPEDALSIPSGQRTVPLPHLSHLCLLATTLEIASFLCHLSYPATTCVRLSCIPNPATDSDFSFLFNENVLLGSPPSSDPTRQPLRSLLIQSISPKAIRIQGWTASGCTDECTPAPQVYLDLAWCGFSEDRADAVMTAVCANLPLSRLRTLSVWHLSHVWKQSWVAAFGHLVQCKTVNVRGPPAYGLALALAAEMDGEGKPFVSSSVDGEGTVPGVFLPGLRKLLIEDTDFGDDMRCGLFFDDLLEGLMDRSEREADVRELHLVECSRISEVEVALLREVVVDVVWDGIEQSVMEDEEEEEDESDSFDSGAWGFPFYEGDLEELEAGPLGIGYGVW
jgi:F-box-like